jgi:crotonobetainyl-CoA:carnitine CoA-transferase CaiB-like acyl-CoA transferase
MTDPQLPINGMTLTTRTSISEATRVINHPVNVRDALRPPIAPAPGLGEHTDDVLAELGFNSTQIRELRTHGVI